MWFGYSHLSRVKLDPVSLGLSGTDLTIAQIIAEETEAEREIQYRNQPPLSAEEALAPAPSTSLLQIGQKTVQEARRSAADEVPWDQLLRTGDAHSRCVERTGLSHYELIEFAIQKCRPLNWDALFWYQQWLREATGGKLGPEAVALLIEDAKARAAEHAAAHHAKQRQEAASKAAAVKVEKDPKTEKKRTVREIWDRWQREPNIYPSQAAFARDMLEKYGGGSAGDLKSQAVIQRWCKEWKDAANGANVTPTDGE
jgi:hypothetical protein